MFPEREKPTRLKAAYGIKRRYRSRAAVKNHSVSKPPVCAALRRKQGGLLPVNRVEP